MCKPASFVVTRTGKVFWSKNSDSHEDIISEFKLNEGLSAVNNEANFVRVEITPPKNDMRNPLNQWEYCLDQIGTPSWYERESVERDARDALKEWFAAKVIVDGMKIDKIESGKWYICGGTVSAIYGGTVSEIRGGTVSAIYGGTVSEIYGGTVSEIWGGTVISYIKINKSLLKSPLAVLVDRSGKTVKCYVGKEEKKAKK